MSKKISDPISVYTEQEIDKRYKKIIINELIREHERAQKLASSLNDIKSKILEVSNLSSKAKEGETDKETVLRLSTFLHTVNDKFKTVSDSFAAFNKYCNPERVEETVEEMDYDNIKLDHQTQVKVEPIQTDVKSYKLDPNTRSFSGASGEKLSQWLFLINNAFLAQNIHVDKIRLALISNYVKGSALNALIRYTNEEKYPSWGGFVNLLKEQFEDTNMEFKLRTQLFHLKMEHNNFQKYLARFQELLNQLPNTHPDNNDILYKFVDGLTKEFAYAVRREKCTTLNKAILVCNDLDSLNKKFEENTKKETVNFVKPNTYKKQVSYKRNYERKPILRAFKVFRKPLFNKTYSNKSSNNKNKSGDSPNKYLAKINNGQAQSSPKDLSKITCVICKQTGHYPNKCPKRQNKIYTISVQDNILDNNLLNVTGRVNSIDMVFTLDTAATCCIMSNKIAQKYGFKIIESDVQVKVAHNETVKVIGKTEKLHVEVKGHTCELEMFVLDNDEYQCLLGLSWFLAVNCSINPSERSIKFNGETFPIDDNKFDLDNDENENVMFSELLPIDEDEFDINFEWREGEFKGIKPETELNSKQLTKIAQISQKIRYGFASNYKELGRCKLLPFKIKLLSDQIVHIPQYRRSIAEQAGRG